MGLFSLFKKRSIRSKEEKKLQIIQEYKTKLQNALIPFYHDKAQLTMKKSQILKQYNQELSRNIYFEAQEIREILTTLAKI